MGMYFSKYSMLKSLVSDDRTYLKSDTINYFERFKLFGFIIHDPFRHQSFHRKLEEIFPRLDYLTGKHFLFFALTNPPQSWKEKENGTYSSRDLDKVWNPHSTYVTADESISAFTLAKSFNIDFDNLPCIVLTTSFASKYFVTIKTSEKLLEKQLTEIGIFCENIPEKSFRFNDASFQHLLKNINFANESEMKNSEGTVASVLSDFLSFVVSNDKTPDSYDAKKEQNRIVKAFQESKKILMKDDMAFENKCLAIMGSFAHLNIFEEKVSYRPDFNFSKNDYSDDLPSYNVVRENINLKARKEYEREIKWDELIEEESKITYKTLLKVLPLLSELELNMDYSPFAIGYFKIFEKEIDLSVVHFVRKYLNIEMPQYFNKIKPDYVTAIVTPEFETQHEQRRINFNKASRGKWLPPGLGESEQVIKYLFEKKNVSIERIGIVQNELMRKWRELRIIRNKAAHPDPLSKDEFNTAKSTFESLIDTGIFMNILNLKQYYKGILP